MFRKTVRILGLLIYKIATKYQQDTHKVHTRLPKVHTRLPKFACASKKNSTYLGPAYFSPRLGFVAQDSLGRHSLAMKKNEFAGKLLHLSLSALTGAKLPPEQPPVAPPAPPAAAGGRRRRRRSSRSHRSRRSSRSKRSRSRRSGRDRNRGHDRDHDHDRRRRRSPSSNSYSYYSEGGDAPQNQNTGTFSGQFWSGDRLPRDCNKYSDIPEKAAMEVLHILSAKRYSAIN